MAKTKTQYFQIRATEQDKELANKLAEVYGVSVSDLIRFALMYVDKERPDFTITISPQKQDRF